MSDETRLALLHAIAADPADAVARARLKDLDRREGRRKEFPPRKKLRNDERPRFGWCPVCQTWSLRRTEQKERRRNGRTDGDSHQRTTTPLRGPVIPQGVWGRVPRRLQTLIGEKRAKPRRVCTGRVTSQRWYEWRESVRAINHDALRRPATPMLSLSIADELAQSLRVPLPVVDVGGRRYEVTPSPDEPPREIVTPPESALRGHAEVIPLRSGEPIAVGARPVPIHPNEELRVEVGFPQPRREIAMAGNGHTPCPGPAKGQHCRPPLAALEAELARLERHCASWDHRRSCRAEADLSWFRHRVAVERKRLGIPTPPPPHECKSQHLDYTDSSRTHVRCDVCQKVYALDRNGSPRGLP